MALGDATVYDQHVMAKLEVTKGTDPVPTAAADSIRVDSVTITKNQANVDRPVVKQTMGNLPHLPDPDASVTAEIVVPLKGSGAAGTAPDMGVLFLGCRMLETVVPATSVTYNPSTAIASEKSVTIYVYKDAMLWKLIGAVGTFVINMEMGAPVSVTFTYQAAYLEPAVTAIPGSIAFDATLPVVAASADVMNDGAAVRCSSFSLDAGNDVQQHRSTGENTFTVFNRNPVLQMTKDSVNTAVEWAALTAGTTAALSYTHGAAAGNIATITAPVGKRLDVGYETSAERDALAVNYGLYESTSDDQFAIAFT